MTRGRVIRTTLVASVVIALCTYSVFFAYKAGCAENAAGMTIKSTELSAYSVWLLLLALPLGGALVATRPTVDGKKTRMQAIGFLLISAPIGFFALYYVAENGARNCDRRLTFGPGASKTHAIKDVGPNFKCNTMSNPTASASVTSLTSCSTGRLPASLVAAC